MDTLLQILLFGGAFFLMMRFGCGSHMFGHGSSNKEKSQAGGHGGGCCGAKKKTAPAINHETRGAPPMEDTDPVCGKTVSTDSAKTSLHDGLVYFFCSTQCRETFEASPGEYAEKDDGAMPLGLEQRAAKEGGHV